MQTAHLFPGRINANIVFGPLKRQEAFTQEQIDGLLECPSAVGHSPMGTVKSEANDTALAEVPAGFIRDELVLLLAGEGLHESVGLIRSRMANMEEPDTVAADLLHGIVSESRSIIGCCVPSEVNHVT